MSKQLVALYLSNRLFQYSHYLFTRIISFYSNEDFNRQLDGFEPNFKFLDSDEKTGSMPLSELVTELKTELGLKRVYVWHALHG